MSNKLEAALNEVSKILAKYDVSIIANGKGSYNLIENELSGQGCPSVSRKIPMSKVIYVEGDQIESKDDL